jgi:hypothetical protein
MDNSWQRTFFDGPVGGNELKFRVVSRKILNDT